MQADSATLKFVEAQQRNAFWSSVAQWGYTVWFIAFGIAAVLLLLYVLTPRETAGDVLVPGWRRKLQRFSPYRSLFVHLGGILLLILCAISHQTFVDQNRGLVADQDKRYDAAIKKIRAGSGKEAALRSQYLYLPKGNSLIYMSLGNPSLAADYVWLTSQQYVANSFRRGQKYEILRRFYDTVRELDPQWVEAAVNGGRVLSAIEPNRYAVEQFYVSAISSNPGNTVLPYEAGRLFIVPPTNLDLRKEYGKRATNWFSHTIDLLKKQPESVQRNKKIIEVENFISRMAVETDAYGLAADVLWKNLSDSNNPRAYRQLSARDWLNARSLVIVSTLQKAVDDFRARNFFYPLQLARIFRAVDPKTFLTFDRFGTPRDAYDYPIEYDPTTGRVASRGVNARAAIQAGTLVNTFLAIFQEMRQGAIPKDLDELQSFVDEQYNSKGNEPLPSMTSALGMDLNVRISPFGTPWKYDPHVGKIEMPPECNAKQLFKNAERMVPRD